MLNSLSRLVGILLGPDAFFVPKVEMILLISVSSQGSAQKTLLIGAFK